MSFSQVLPMPPPHFGTGSDFHTSALYSPSQDYSSMSHNPIQDLLGRYSEQQTSTISPQLLPSSPPYSRGPSRQPFGLPQTPPIRNRTPIRHHRTNEPRARSSSRPDALLAYATEMQRRQSNASALVFRSAPNSPPVHQQSEYFMPVSSTMYPTQSSYYTAPIPQPLNQYETGRGAFGSESSSSAYFPLSRATSHDMATLNPQDALYLPNALPLTTLPLPPLASSFPSFPPTSMALESSSGDNFRILATRERPQCWEHGCNGRQFSTFSNLLRHQREKSGSAMKSICPHCGTEFTRTTARNGHMYGGKCKGKSDHSGSDNGSSDEKTTQ